LKTPNFEAPNVVVDLCLIPNALNVEGVSARSSKVMLGQSIKEVLVPDQVFQDRFNSRSGLTVLFPEGIEIGSRVCMDIDVP
jgi:hypothetical protein